MQKNIEALKCKRRRDAVTGALLFTGIQVISAAAFAALCRIPDLPGWAFVLFAVLAVSCLVLILPVLPLLKQRFQEIEGGELDEAGKY